MPEQCEICGAADRDDTRHAMDPDLDAAWIDPFGFGYLCEVTSVLGWHVCAAVCTRECVIDLVFSPPLAMAANRYRIGIAAEGFVGTVRRFRTGDDDELVVGRSESLEDLVDAFVRDTLLDIGVHLIEEVPTRFGDKPMGDVTAALEREAALQAACDTVLGPSCPLRALPTGGPP